MTKLQVFRGNYLSMLMRQSGVEMDANTEHTSNVRSLLYTSLLASHMMKWADDKGIKIQSSAEGFKEYEPPAHEVVRVTKELKPLNPAPKTPPHTEMGMVAFLRNAFAFFGSAPALQEASITVEPAKTPRHETKYPVYNKSDDYAHELTAEPGKYDHTKRTITLNANLPDYLLAPILVRLIREAWQHDQGMVPNTAQDAQHYLVQQRLLQADRTMHEVAAAFQMKDHDTRAWTPVYRRSFGAASTYAGHMQNDLLKDDNMSHNLAMASAFRAFFTSSSQTISALDAKTIADIARQKKDIADARALSATTDFDAVADMRTKVIPGLDVSKPDEILKLGQSMIPDGRNYLQGQTATMHRDPVFMGRLQTQNRKALESLKN
jgi:hypothetical protein